MLEKEEDHRRKELALEEKHSRDLAKKSQARAEEMAQRPSSGEVSGEEEDGRGTLGIRGRTSSKVRRTKIKPIVHAITLVLHTVHCITYRGKYELLLYVVQHNDHQHIHHPYDTVRCIEAPLFLSPSVAQTATYMARYTYTVARV